VNDASGGILMPFLLLALWIIILVSQLQYGFARALLTSSIVGAMLAMFLTILNMLSPSYMYMSLIVVALSVVLVRLNHND